MIWLWIGGGGHRRSARCWPPSPVGAGIRSSRCRRRSPAVARHRRTRRRPRARTRARTGSGSADDGRVHRSAESRGASLRSRSGRGRAGRAGRPGSRSCVAIPIGVVLALLIVVLGTRKAAVDRTVTSPLIGKQAPAVKGTTLTGQQFDLGRQNRWVLVNFFASWCVPCVQEHPELRAFQQEHAAKGDVESGERRLRRRTGRRPPLLQGERRQLAGRARRRRPHRSRLRRGQGARDLSSSRPTGPSSTRSSAA